MSLRLPKAFGDRSTHVGATAGMHGMESDIHSGMGLPHGQMEPDSGQLIRIDEPGSGGTIVKGPRRPGDLTAEQDPGISSASPQETAVDQQTMENIVKRWAHPDSVQMGNLFVGNPGPDGGRIVTLDEFIRSVTVENTSSVQVDIFLGSNVQNGGVPLFSVAAGAWKRVPLQTASGASVMAVPHAGAGTGMARVWVSNKSSDYGSGAVTV